ncbi:NAD(P)-dependent alcohol dehydrogenase [Arcticibacterium luteifluviistationis]|uniref:NAD(P)-dependent alcohol dehydrogenase n=1 Tax=Arcticibacterium luteifluviistationis TaxID=1784714 RepID=A0A2Z4GCV9_9BACT|nr:NAD(P)-dependent alcohol dehydrogenase [Arcticibacterium luteifluviistationis]AWV99066.1 NAD(P)-dependent alcohol dehydrogenase [Arcticibacterium luteifluviistationis]
MKAIKWLEYGSPEHLKLEEVPKPSPKGNEVLIKVKAASVNRTDCAIFYGKPFFMRFMTGLFKPRDITLGTEFSGVIEEVGAEVRSFKKGDEVFGLNTNGLRAHAEYLVLSEKEAFAIKPSQLSFEEAAACTEGAHYGLNFLNKVDLKPGDKVLVNGATGGIGSATLQLAKYFGAEVTAVGNTKNLKLLKSLGADIVINYETEDFTKLDIQFDFIFDAVGKSTFFKCKPLLKRKGVYMSSELGPWSQNLLLPIIGKFSKGKKVKFPLPLNIKENVLLVKKLMESGDLKPVIDRIYPLEKVGEAFTYVFSGEKTGNVAIKV